MTMGISERRKREKIERRKAILNCARELILSQGVQQVSMEDIARKAELSKATVYLYFSSKDFLLNEICEETAQVFMEHLKPFLETGTTGIAALRCFWRIYVELFGNFNEMIVVFQVRNFLNPGLPVVSLKEQIKSPNVDNILETIKNIIEQCKYENVFASDLDSAMATRLLLSVFSVIVENAALMPAESRNSGAIIEEMKTVFQIIIRGFAREGINREQLIISE
jgi:AcrR family transcriptional regulator